MPWTTQCFSASILFFASVTSYAAPNTDFETDLPGSPPADWQVQTVDAVTVIEIDDGSTFPVFSELGVTVAPNLGSQMARLGVPRDRNEQQNRGVNSIQAQFESQRESLTLAVRVFSFEHRGDDTVLLNLTDAQGSSYSVAGDGGGPFVLDMPKGSDPSCSATPCEMTIDIGARNDTLAGDWQFVTFGGLPADGTVLTLTLGVDNGQNEALTTWMYVDAVNAKPEAVITYNPGSVPGSEVVEGDYMVFDCSESMDPEGQDLTCSWLANGPGVANVAVEGDIAVFVFDNEGSATVTLEVSDGIESDTATVHVPIDNAPPIANAIDVEVLPDGTVELLCRFVDPGVNDTHTVTFDVTAPTSDFQIQEENVPALSSGFATTVLDASGISPGVLDGYCVVQDDAGSNASTMAHFQIDVLDSLTPVTSSLLNVNTIDADGSYLGALTTPDQIAVYEIRDASGGPLTVGTEVNIAVHVPTDLDAVLLNGSTEGGVAIAPWVSAPWVSAPWVSAPWVNVPFVSLPFVSLPFVSLPFVSAPWVSLPWVSAPFISAPIESSPWVSAGFEFVDFPLSQVGLAAPDGSQISGADVTFEDLGALSAGSLNEEELRVKALSAEFGTGTERMLVKIGPGEQGLFLAIVPQAGSFSSAPFNIQVEASQPPPQSELLQAQCDGVPLVGSPVGSTVLHENGDPKTLVVTQRERLMATFDMDEIEFEDWFAQLVPFFEHANVQAKVISVPSAWYDQADTEPCVVAEQNLVAELIKGAIQDELEGSSIEYVQLMGSLDIVPPYYTPDETQTGYEGLFSSDLWTLPGTPLSVAILEGNNITDAFYVDAQPQPFRGRSLYTEDISVSRMVETPEEILASAARFVSTGGVINLTSTQSTGYDFFIDGTQRINDVLATLPVPTKTLNDDTWDVTQLRCNFFGQGEGCQISELNAVNAHMSYNGGITADGFFTSSPDEVFASVESADILNGVTFSIGCHSGLSVPDAWALPADAGLPLDPARDWVQELGAWVGSYNFAYGDTEVDDRGTEGIMPLVIANFVAGQTLGNALIQAKWQYGTGLFEFGVYDEKSMIALNLFGMPQARLDESLVQADAQALVSNTQSAGGGFTLNYEELGSVTRVDASLDQVTSPEGTYYTLNDMAQAIVGRVLQPVVRPFELREVLEDETSVHGVLLRSGSYTEILDQDPVLPVQSHDWVTSVEEPRACVETMSPTQIGSVTRFDAPSATLQTFILQPGQFECTLDPIDQGVLPVAGTFRIWHEVDVELTHPDDIGLEEDMQPPVVTRQDLIADPTTGTVTATLDATDASGLREIVALIYEDEDGVEGGDGAVRSVTTGVINSAGPYILALENAYQDSLAFQYVDRGGNITAKTLKGALLQAIDIEILTTVFSNDSDTTIRVEVENFAALQAPYLEVDFGDGSPPLLLELTNADGTPISEVTVDADGTAIIEVTHSYAGFGGMSVTVTATVRGAGAVGRDEATLFACSDPLGDALIANGDIVGCGLGIDGDRIFVDLFVAGEIDASVQYRVRLLGTNQQIRYSDGEVTGPRKLRPEVTLQGTSGLRFSVNAARSGWDGVSPFEFQLSTQEGVSGGPSAGTVDETEEFAFELN